MGMQSILLTWPKPHHPALQTCLQPWPRGPSPGTCLCQRDSWLPVRCQQASGRKVGLKCCWGGFVMLSLYQTKPSHAFVSNPHRNTDNKTAKSLCQFSLIKVAPPLISRKSYVGWMLQAAEKNTAWDFCKSDQQPVFCHFLTWKYTLFVILSEVSIFFINDTLDLAK